MLLPSHRSEITSVSASVCVVWCRGQPNLTASQIDSTGRMREKKEVERTTELHPSSVDMPGFEFREKKTEEVAMLSQYESFIKDGQFHIWKEVVLVELCALESSRLRSACFEILSFVCFG